MFSGHLGVAFAAKATEPKAPLAALVAASFGVDLLWSMGIRTASLLGVDVSLATPGNP